MWFNGAEKCVHVRELNIAQVRARIKLSRTTRRQPAPPADVDLGKRQIRESDSDGHLMAPAVEQSVNILHSAASRRHPRVDFSPRRGRLQVMMLSGRGGHNALARVKTEKWLGHFGLPSSYEPYRLGVVRAIK